MSEQPVPISVTPDLEQAWTEFKAYLKKVDARTTHARRIVFETVLRRDDHFRADDLAASLARGEDRVSRGTVYRTLALMNEAGFVRKIRDGDVHYHYEQVYGREHHEHMICNNCGRFIEFDTPEVSAMLRRRCEEFGFQEESHRVTVFGTCRECRQK